MTRAATLALLPRPCLPRGPGPGPGPMRGPGGPAHGARILLAHTGELELTDAQVVRLAGIARRAHARHEAMRANMPASPASGAERRQPSPEDAQRMRQAMEQGREQARTELRDALAVLTPDQQARAWEMMARRGGGMRGRGGPGGPSEVHGPGDVAAPVGVAAPESVAKGVVPVRLRRSPPTACGNGGYVEDRESRPLLPRSRAGERASFRPGPETAARGRTASNNPWRSRSPARRGRRDFRRDLVYLAPGDLHGLPKRTCFP